MYVCRHAHVTAPNPLVIARLVHEHDCKVDQFSAVIHENPYLACQRIRPQLGVSSPCWPGHDGLKAAESPESKVVYFPNQSPAHVGQMASILKVDGFSGCKSSDSIIKIVVASRCLVVGRKPPQAQRTTMSEVFLVPCTVWVRFGSLRCFI